MTPDATPPVSDPGREPDEASIHDAAALWNAICRVSGDYIVVVDRHGTMRFCNRAGDGFTTDHVVGRSICDFTTPESAIELRREIDEVFATGAERRLETTVKTLTGAINYFSLRLGPVIASGRTVGVLVCCENILPLKTSEQSLNHERNVLRRLLAIQERERQLVSYEIHDGLSQYLAGALMHLQAYRYATPDATAIELEEGIRLLQAAAEESRRLIGGLRPPALDELGIVEAVEALLDDARVEIPAIAFVHSLPGGRLPPQLETTIFRIVQESITNARKHAAAGSLRVEIERLGDRVRLRVEDDGAGFDPALVPEDRFGLEGIRQRARLLGGEPQITSRPGQGTTIEVVLAVPA